MSAESSAAIIRRMADADNAASMRRLERQLADALRLLEELTGDHWRWVDGLDGTMLRERVEALLSDHDWPGTWRRGGAT